MLSMISYLNLSSGVYIPLYWFFVIKIFNIYCFFKPNWWMLKIWSPNHHWTVPSMKWISLYHLYAAYMRWISGGFFVKKHLTQPWGKFSTLLQPFYNLPGWPGVLKADDMCINEIAEFEKMPLNRKTLLKWNLMKPFDWLQNYCIAEITQTRLKNKKSFISLKHAVGSYQERVQFVKESSRACMVREKLKSFAKKP